MELDNVLKKLRKLQKLYEGAKSINSESEAATAAALIQKLLVEYNLTMAEVSNNEKIEENEVMEHFCSGFNYRSVGGKWEYQLWYVLCKWNFCKCFMYGNSCKSLVIFGKKENLEMVQWLHDMLSERYVEFSRKRFHEYEKTEEYTMSFRRPSMDKFQRSYLMGVVWGLDTKLEEVSEKDKQDDKEYGDKVTALVVRSNTDIDDFIAKKYGGTKTGHRRNTNYMSSAYTKGRIDGYNTDLYKPIQQNMSTSANRVKFIQ